MKKLLLPIVLAVLGLGGGLAGGQMLRPPPVEEDQGDGLNEAAEPTAETEAERLARIERDLEGYERPERTETPAIDDVGIVYHKLDKQFIVPVIAQGRVQSLMVISIALRITEGYGTTVFDHEPKLRDEFLQTLFIHGQSEGFATIFQKPHVLADLRDSLLQAAKRVLGDVAHEVLLTNIVRKDV